MKWNFFIPLFLSRKLLQKISFNSSKSFLLHQLKKPVVIHFMSLVIFYGSFSFILKLKLEKTIVIPPVENIKGLVKF